MNIYLITTIQHVVSGPGESKRETCLARMKPNEGDPEFYFAFKTREEAKDYIKDDSDLLGIIELELI